MLGSSSLGTREYLLLVWIDWMLATVVQTGGCQRCVGGGGLVERGFWRKTGGVAVGGRPGPVWRISFRCTCCGLRTTPPSVRFFRGQAMSGAHRVGDHERRDGR